MVEDLFLRHSGNSEGYQPGRHLQDQETASGLGTALMLIVINDLAADLSVRGTEFSDGLKPRGKILPLDD